MGPYGASGPPQGGRPFANRRPPQALPHQSTFHLRFGGRLESGHPGADSDDRASQSSWRIWRTTLGGAAPTEKFSARLHHASFRTATSANMPANMRLRAREASQDKRRSLSNMRDTCAGTSIHSAEERAYPRAEAPTRHPPHSSAMVPAARVPIEK